MSIAPERRRALWVLGAGDLGGVARHALDVAENGVPGWDVEFLLPPGPLAARLRAVGAAVVARPFGPGAGPLRSLRSLGSLGRERRYDIVHSHLAWADLLVATGIVRHARRISTEHGIADVPLLYQSTAAHAALMRWLHRIRLRRTHDVIAVSHATAATIERLWGRPRARCIVIPNGIDPVRAAPGSGRHRFGYVGRLATEKDLPAVISAFATVLRTLPDATLDIAGEGPLGPWIASEVERRHWAERVRLRGWVPAERLLDEIDVLVQLPHWENCSYSLLEAAARGRGVVTTAVGGNGEILPAACLVVVGAPGLAAAAMIEQARRPWPRTRLPPGWPTVADMCGDVARVYEGAGSARGHSW